MRSETSERQIRQAVIAVAHALHARGWVANHDGNVTARLGARGFLCTPTATSKAAVTDATLLVIDGDGKRTSGTSRPFGERDLHLAVYARRADVHAVVHAHPPHATALACSGSLLLERPFIAEAVVSLGTRIPTVPFAAPGPAAAQALAAYVDDVDAVLLGHHGVLTWAHDVELAYLRLELVEHLARIAILAQATGGIVPLPDSVLADLLRARAQAGLGAAANRAADSVRTVVACAPAPHAAVTTASPGADPNPSVGADRVAALVREEILRALGRL
jgi:L-fuculose-phosphate aldolase